MDFSMPYFNPFDFGGGTAAPLPNTLPPAPLPEQVAGFLGAQGVTPQDFLRNPLAFVPQSGGTPSLGDSLQPGATPPTNGGVPLPTPRPAEAGPGANAQASAQPSLGDRLQAGLKGVKAPEPPQAQKVATPHASVPGPHGSIKGGDLIALLAALGGQIPTAKVPLSLGTALGGRYG